MDRTTFVRRWAAAFAAVAALGVAGCSSNKVKQPPFPTDPDPCASYCLVWVPPVFRNVPHVCPKPGYCENVEVPVSRVEFDEVCKPGECETKCVPDDCRRFGVVEVEAAHDEWVKVKCQDACGGCKDCWRSVRVPAKTKWCEKCETEKGFQYCAYTPPTYTTVPRTVCGCEKVTRYVPAAPEVTWKKECFEPGHWVWERRYDCGAPKPRCPPKRDCAPIMGPDPVGPPARGDFRRCPCAN